MEDARLQSPTYLGRARRQDVLFGRAEKETVGMSKFILRKSAAFS